MFWVCLGVGVALHLSLTRLGDLEAEQQTAKPLTTQFVKRQPRLTKPLELKKRPQPKRRQIQRTMVAVQAQTRRAEASGGIGGLALAGRLARPSVEVWRSARFQATDIEPEALAQAVEGEKEAKSVMDMSLELLDVGAMDTGQYHAMVIQDPSDKRNIRGFFHVAAAYSVNMSKDLYWQEVQSRIRFGLVRLADTINQYTEVRTDVSGNVELDSQDLLKTPWVWVYPVYNFVLSESEASNLGRYMLTGGFLVSDSAHHRVIAMRAAAADQLVVDALAAEGKALGSDWNYARLPNSHPVYHCFFDFPEGPPTAGDWMPGAHVDYLDGVYFSGRLVCIRSLKNFENAWSDQGPGGAPASRGQYAALDPQRALQFGVNLIVFALTQEGSITNRVIDSVSY